MIDNQPKKNESEEFIIMINNKPYLDKFADTPSNKLNDESFKPLISAEITDYNKGVLD